MLAVMLAVASSVIISVAYLNVIAGGLIPILVEALANAKAPDWLKTSLALLLSAVSAIVTQTIANGGLLMWRLALVSIALTFITNLAAHLGVWKPLQITGPTGAVQRITGGRGLGAAPAPLPAPPAPGAADPGRLRR